MVKGTDFTNQCDDLEFGLRGDGIVLISEITPAENGDKCNCVCPSCRMPLRAKTLGDERRPHFAHRHVNKDCNTNTARESALHHLAKEILRDKREFLFPEIRIFESDLSIPNRLNTENIPKSLVFRKKKLLPLDDLCFEERIEDVIPDCIASVKGKKCIIEIAVTHKIDEVKYEKLKKIGIPVIQVNLKKWYQLGCSREEIEKAIISDPNNRRWIFNPLFEEARIKICEKYIALYDQYRRANPEEAREADRALQREKALEKYWSLLNQETAIPAEVKPLFDGIDYIYDDDGDRIILCDQCGKVKKSLYMSLYGGDKTPNRGICSLCARNLK